VANTCFTNPNACAGVGYAGFDADARDADGSDGSDATRESDAPSDVLSDG
jgi:hypothetical protein